MRVGDLIPFSPAFTSKDEFKHASEYMLMVAKSLHLAQLYELKLKSCLYYYDLFSEETLIQIKESNSYTPKIPSNIGFIIKKLREILGEDYNDDMTEKLDRATKARNYIAHESCLLTFMQPNMLRKHVQLLKNELMTQISAILDADEIITGDIGGIMRFIAPQSANSDNTAESSIQEIHRNQYRKYIEDWIFAEDPNNSRYY